MNVWDKKFIKKTDFYQNILENNWSSEEKQSFSSNVGSNIESKPQNVVVT